MKKADYRKALDKVKCSKELRSAVLEKLAADSLESDEYTHVISNVEKAKPRSISRTIAALAACAVIVTGAAAAARFPGRKKLKI